MTTGRRCKIRQSRKQYKKKMEKLKQGIFGKLCLTCNFFKENQLSCINAKSHLQDRVIKCPGFILFSEAFPYLKILKLSGGVFIQSQNNETISYTTRKAFIRRYGRKGEMVIFNFEALNEGEKQKAIMSRGEVARSKETEMQRLFL